MREVRERLSREWRWLCFRFPLKEINYLMFSFPRSGNEAKPRVEFRHSTHNASRIQRKVVNGVKSVLIGRCGNVYGIQSEAEKNPNQIARETETKPECTVYKNNIRTFHL